MMVLDGEQYRIIVESSPNLIWRAGTDAKCDYFNATWLSYTGRSMEQELGNGWAEGVHPDDYNGCLKTYLEAFEKRVGFEMIYRLKRHDGEWRWIHDKGTPFFDEAGRFAGYIGSCIDVNEQITGETWKSMAQKDGLTGAYNRLYFDQEAKEQIETARRQGSRLTIVMFDIDKFKSFNDRYGHPFGDKILVTFTGVLKDNIRDTDLLGRYGGDEFILLLPETSRQGAEVIIDRIRQKCTQPFSFQENDRVFLSFSHGVAELDPGGTYERLIEQADDEMYQEKKQKS
jgi:diguanylate cyclase (GGDEF)-like protein/PAS domain S-box-containing protein